MSIRPLFVIAIRGNFVKLVVIDCGTTNCRMRLIDNGVLLDCVSKQTGAKDVAIANSNILLRHALSESYLELCSAQPEAMNSVEGVIASGMITSNMGLYEVAHINGPVDIVATARGMQAASFFDICSKPILFVPGIKFVSNHEAECDMIRGEETEVWGYLSRLSNKNYVKDNQLIIHYGSHHKWIKINSQSVVQCRTSITGELLMAVSEHTLLKNSLVSLDHVKLEQEWVRKGYETERKYGAGHALFSVRTLEVLSKQSKQAATSFMLGIMVALDLAMLTDELLSGVGQIVLYGRSLFPSITAPILKDKYPNLRIEIISEEESAQLSTYGASQLYQIYKEEIGK
jgi:2-dehydro-3-deoxygalactonokinase